LPIFTPEQREFAGGKPGRRAALLRTFGFWRR
jgi:hypothetical protein